MVQAARFQRRVYRPGKWFWIVSDRPGVVFSSEVPGYIDPHDERFVQFVSRGLTPTRIPSGTELADVLRAAGLSDVVVQAATAKAEP